MQDYSQGGEQEHILRAVNAAKIRKGRVLDVGAADGITFSNSRALIERGWSGVMVEPSPTAILALNQLYGSNRAIELVNAAVGQGWDLRCFHYTADMVSTVDEQFYELWRSAAEFTGHFFVPIIPLWTIFKRFGPFDVVSIDVEGGSADLMPTVIDFRPRVIVVEHDGRPDEVARTSAHNYDEKFRNGTNSVLVWKWPTM